MIHLKIDKQKGLVSPKQKLKRIVKTKSELPTKIDSRLDQKNNLVILINYELYECMVIPYSSINLAICL